MSYVLLRLGDIERVANRYASAAVNFSKRIDGVLSPPHSTSGVITEHSAPQLGVLTRVTDTDFREDTACWLT